MVTLKKTLTFLKENSFLLLFLCVPLNKRLFILLLLRSAGPDYSVRCKIFKL